MENFGNTDIWRTFATVLMLRPLSTDEENPCYIVPFLAVPASWGTITVELKIPDLHQSI